MLGIRNTHNQTAQNTRIGMRGVWCTPNAKIERYNPREDALQFTQTTGKWPTKREDEKHTPTPTKPPLPTTTPNPNTTNNNTQNLLRISPEHHEATPRSLKRPLTKTKQPQPQQNPLQLKLCAYTYM